MKLGKGSCNGTFGELVQGIIGDRRYLITLPISSLRSEARFIPDPIVKGIRVADSKVKAQRAGEWLFQLFGVKGGGDLEIRSNIPVGKGLASSSADIVAALRAIADSYSLPLTNEMISMIAAKVEPTDGVMYEEVVVYDYIHGQLIESFGALPPFILVGIDLGGMINTIEFNEVPKEYSQNDQQQFIKAYDLVTKGFKEKNLTYIGEAATLSARVNQKILPKPVFPLLDQLAYRYQGGIVVAHSGTVAGILLDGNLPNGDEVVSHLFREMSLAFKGVPINLFHYESREKNSRASELGEKKNS
ncbi:kinase [Bacillus sp. ISL-40]|uniref:GHMP family kinase ATP-binding protein n=1 Tax=unclassified Bacillus (in: firmicutes) TaxID=185979 RepID=UPI001BE932C3|nr:MULTISPECIES: kinase [unclassified Bacillus (in: firmicutes)]MBT2698511.1 kinase [Bacillus sp. ISL-40]MBT2739263.1 kinase [Bacillus sp. ISL-77]